MKTYGNESSLMQKTVDLMNEFCYVLTQMERSGIAIDIETLDKLQEEYSKEQVELSEKLHMTPLRVICDVTDRRRQNV